MTNVFRWALVVLLVAHALIHLLGAAKGFGWAEVRQLSQPIGVGTAVVWLVAALLVLSTAVLIAVGTAFWWSAAAAAVVSQVAVVTSWNDAKFGTAINVVLIVAAVYGLASRGPTSLDAQWQRQADQALEVGQPPRGELVTERDLSLLPQPLAAYIRRSGAVGKPRVSSFSADFHGRIRNGPESAWMPFTGTQVNTYGAGPRRLFIMHAKRSGLPVTVLHSFIGASATMKAKVLSLFTVVNASGPEMDQGETVTVFNDLVVLAPGAIVGAPVRWTAVDAHHVRGVFTNGDRAVSAELTFNADNDLVDFVSTDRLRASPDGRSFQQQVWSTPLSRYRDVGGRRVLSVGEARWHPPQPEGAFTYVELKIDAIAYDVNTVAGQAATAPTPTDALR